VVCRCERGGGVNSLFGDYDHSGIPPTHRENSSHWSQAVDPTDRFVSIGDSCVPVDTDGSANPSTAPVLKGGGALSLDAV
ncbi:hypothetical protein BHM03_00061759, partial [Ensete ventricosum]